MWTDVRVSSAAVVPEYELPERAGDRRGFAAARRGRLEAGRGVGVDLVEGLALEQGACERFELGTVLVQPAERVLVALLHDSARLDVDQLTRRLRDGAVRQRAVPVGREHRHRPDRL